MSIRKVFFSFLALALATPLLANSTQVVSNLSNTRYAYQSTMLELMEHALASQGSLDELSQALLASSVQGNEAFYTQAKSALFDPMRLTPLLARQAPPTDFIEILGTEGDENAQGAGYYAWVLGRALIAAEHMQDNSTANALSHTIRTLLTAKETQVDRYAVWGWGYLLTYEATHDSDAYQNDKAHLIEFRY